MLAKTYDVMGEKLIEIVSQVQNFTDYKDSTIVVPVFKSDFNEEGNSIKAEDLKKLDEKLNSKLSRNIKLNKFNGKEEAVLTTIIDDNNEVTLIGCGDEPTFEQGEYIEQAMPGYEKLRMIGIKTTQYANKSSKEGIAFALRGFDKAPEKGLILRTLADGFIRGSYKFDYKKKDDKESKNKDENKVKKITVLITDDYKDIANVELKNGSVIGKSVNVTRSLVDEPSNVLYPETMVEIAKEFLKDSPCEIEVWDQKRIKEEGMGCFSAVAAGNEGFHEAKLLIIRSKKKSKNGKLSLIGKGITFDTGGYNLKPSGKFHALMKNDMGGSATVIGATKSILDLDLDIELISAVALSENSISRTAFKPGDVYTAYNGKSVEIMNTDAEGRLVLCDAISYIVENEKPDYLVDVATLTGACLVSLGLKTAAYLGTNTELNKLFASCGNDSAEAYWELPLMKNNRYLLDGTISDLTNLNKDHSGWAGTIIAGLFLKEFIGDCKNWIHVDIAGPAMALAKTYLGEGGLGHSVATFIRYAEKLSQKK
jgi:leucyl aminopeptidase